MTEGIDAFGLLECEGQRKSMAVPLEYLFLPVQILSKEFTKLNNPHPHRIHYLGPRFASSLALHKKYSLCLKQQYTQDNLKRYTANTRQMYPISAEKHANPAGVFYRAFEGMNPSLHLEQQFVFNSIFEGGNLDCVIKVQPNEFDLFLRIDSNTRGHTLWFYFSVRNPSHTNQVKLNICNMSKGKSLYSNGMQPYVYSCKKGGDWHQAGLNLGLTKTELRYPLLKDKCANVYNCLCLEYEFEYQNDEVYFAYCIPFTYSRLLQEINSLPSIARVNTLGKSLSGLDIPMIQIGEGNKCILVTGRIHPAESNSSIILDKFIKELCDNPELRSKATVVIIPMVNPDGVVGGNSRTSLAGKDLNRQYLNGKKQLYPEVHLVQHLAQKLQQHYGLFMYLDFHGHSRKKNTFLYGPAFSICEPNYYKCRVFAKLIQKISDYFRYHSCSFSIDEEKKQTARAAMADFGVLYSYTIESSIGFFYDSHTKTTQKFTRLEWQHMGKTITTALDCFLTAHEEYVKLLQERRAARIRKTKNQKLDKGDEEDQEQFISYQLPDQKPLSPDKTIKLPYRDKSMFTSIIEEVKKKKNIQQIEKHLDCDEDSNDHDSEEDFELSKEKQLDNLILEYSKNTLKNNVQQVERIKTAQIKPDMDQINLFQELAVKKQRKKTRELFQLSAERKRNKKVQKDQLRFLNQTQVVHCIYEGQRQRRPKTRQIRQKLNFISPTRGKLNSDLKGTYFGEYQLMIDRNNLDSQRQRIASLQRVSLFSRQKLRQSQSRMRDRRKIQNIPSQVNIKQNKAIIVQFKFQGLDAFIEQKSRISSTAQQRIVRINKSQNKPSSYYRIKHNLTTKYSNQKSVLSKDSNYKQLHLQSNKVQL